MSRARAFLPVLVVHHNATLSAYIDTCSKVVGALGRDSGRAVSVRLNRNGYKMLPCGTPVETR